MVVGHTCKHGRQQERMRATGYIDLTPTAYKSLTREHVLARQGRKQDIKLAARNFSRTDKTREKKVKRFLFLVSSSHSNKKKRKTQEKHTQLIVRYKKLALCPYSLLFSSRPGMMPVTSCRPPVLEEYNHYPHSPIRRYCASFYTCSIAMSDMLRCRL